MSKFKKYYLLARKGRKIVAEGPMSPDLYDLISKRINSKRQYDEKDLETYKKLIKLSGLDFNTRGSGLKQKVVQGRYSPTKKPAQSVNRKKYVYYSSPDELLARLNIVISQLDNGNKSKELMGEMSDLATLLKDKGVISETQFISLIDSVTF
jgi:hypothetical protein